MGEKTKRFMQELKKTLSSLGSATSKTLNDLDQADKKLQEKMKKSMGTASQY
jgi:flagellar biosynthesis chaperone FliJ